MGTLSTPLNSGVFADAASLALVLGGLLAFVFGANDLARRSSFYRRLELDTATAGTYSLLALLALVVALMLCGLRSIPVGQAIFLGVAGWGLGRAALRARSVGFALRRASRAELVRPGVLGLAIASTLLFWAYVCRSHVAMPNHRDGIVHGALYLRILEAKVPTLGRVSIWFQDVFGEQTFGFYPTGMHSLFAMSGGFWGQWSVTSHAGVLKAFFTLALAFLPWALYWFLRRLAPNMPWWVAAAVACVASPGFRFPLEAAHEGGASRLVAHLLLTPIYAGAVLGRFDSLRWRVPMGVVLALAFLIHPTGFISLAALLAYSTLYAALTQRRARAWLALFGGFLVTLLVGGLLVSAILRWNFAVAVPRDTAKPFAWWPLLMRWRDGFTTLFSAEYGTAPFHAWLAALGLVALCFGRRALGLSARVVAFPFWMLLVFMTTLAAQMSSHPLARLLGGTFYDEVPRIVELLFEPLGLCLAGLLWGTWYWLDSISASSARLKRAPLGWAACVVLGAFGYQGARLTLAREHIAFWDREFDTPQIDKLRALGIWIEENTEPEALLVHAPFDAEIWRLWTGRPSSFMFGECHTERRQAPCLARKALITAQLATIDQRLEQPTPAERCLEPLDAFKRPIYILSQSEVALKRRGSKRRARLCLDAAQVNLRSGHLIIEYHKPG